MFPPTKRYHCMICSPHTGPASGFDDKRARMNWGEFESDVGGGGEDLGRGVGWGAGLRRRSRKR